MRQVTITFEESDQTPAGKASNILIGTAAQITDNVERLNEARLTMPLLWPPFQSIVDVPVSKTLDDMRQLNEEIMPQVEAMRARSPPFRDTGPSGRAGCEGNLPLLNALLGSEAGGVPPRERLAHVEGR